MAKTKVDPLALPTAKPLGRPLSKRQYTGGGPREYVPSAYDETVAWALETGEPVGFEVQSEEQAKAVASEFRRAVRHAGGYVKLRFSDGLVEAQVSSTPTREGGERKYTSEQIRAWAAEQELDMTPDKPGSKAIPQAVRQAFKEAHGYA